MKEVCFTISEIKGRKRTLLKPVWLTKRQLEALMLCYYSVEQGKGARPWGQDAKSHRELQTKRIVTKLHGGHRCYFVNLTEDGRLLAESIEKAAKKAAPKASRRSP